MNNDDRAREIMLKAIDEVQKLGYNIFVCTRDANDTMQTIKESKPISIDEDNLFINTITYET